MHINQEGQRLDGIERIDDDGTVTFAEQNRAMLKEVLGYECRRMPLSGVESWARDLQARYRSFVEQGVIRTLIFDFDGLLVDSETVIYQSWLEVYQHYHYELPLDQWIRCIGGSGMLFDAHAYLESLIGQPLSRQELDAQCTRRQMELMANLGPLPGVEQYLSDARRLGLKIGLASSSSRAWVEGHLTRLGLQTAFDCIRCADDVTETKPHPERSLSVLKTLAIRADHAIAFEDSPNGIQAVQRAGMFCIVVPSAMTRHLQLEDADVRLTSLTDMPLEILIATVEARRVHKNLLT
jgi:putative hydrolase of the HAD superfamily